MKLARFLTRLSVAIFICGLIAFGNVVPAIAARSNLDKGMEQLSNIQTRTEEAAKAGPYDTNKKYESNQGLNEIPDRSGNGVC